MLEFAKDDPRIKLVNKENTGYGDSMNKGLSLARGKYIAFLESDDFVKKDMYKILFQISEENDLDIVKADYFEIRGESPDYISNSISLLTDKSKYNKVYDPSKEPWIFYVPMMNCLGLFKRDFLNKNFIRHNNTPGASQQDMGFWFQTFTLAKRIMFVNTPFYCYRQDNPNSSINNHKKLTCVKDEYDFMYSFLKRNPEILKWNAPIYYHRMFGSFWYTYNKTINYMKPIFLEEIMKPAFLAAQNNGDFSLDRYSLNEKKIIHDILTLDSLDFCCKLKFNNSVETLIEEVNEQKLINSRLKNEIALLKESNTYKIGKIVTLLPRKIKTFLNQRSK